MHRHIWKIGKIEDKGHYSGDGTGTRYCPITAVVSKQLRPVFADHSLLDAVSAVLN
jgi:dTDP-glucose pyrophosphorylase